MLDAYSFDIDRENSLQTYEKIKSIFSRILNRLGIEFTINSADSDKIGGSVSEEFVARFDNSTIEIAHIFYLGTIYSESGDLYIQLSTGERVPVHMGCYGTSLTRLIPVLIYQNTTSSGLIWSAVITPFDVEIIQAIPDEEIVNKSRNLEDFLQKRGYRVLLDDRDEKYGVKIKDAEMLGAPYFIIVGKKYHRGYIELRDRRNNQVLYVP
ncbi:MAG: aminoacyl--tRNA ligase-related protein [Candidatus Aenigmatarchaeota archaeon]|nr:hypothetical protein [Candidatus Aenigmarchaeota archaeon]